MCKYRQIKNKEAPLAWAVRIIQPLLISRQINDTLSKAVEICAE